MIDINGSIAKKTVPFDRPVTGAELMLAVQAAVQSKGGSYYEEKIYDDGVAYVVGRTGWNGEHVLVTPDKTSALIDPDRTYDSAVVVRHDHPIASHQYSEGMPATRDHEIAAVVSFSDHLATAVREQQQQTGVDAGRDPNAPAAQAARGNPTRAAAAAAAQRAGHDQGTGYSY